MVGTADCLANFEQWMLPCNALCSASRVLSFAAPTSEAAIVGARVMGLRRVLGEQESETGHVDSGERSVEGHDVVMLNIGTETGV